MEMAPPADGELSPQQDQQCEDRVRQSSSRPFLGASVMMMVCMILIIPVNGFQIIPISNHQRTQHRQQQSFIPTFTLPRPVFSSVLHDSERTVDIEVLSIGASSTTTTTASLIKNGAGNGTAMVGGVLADVESLSARLAATSRSDVPLPTENGGYTHTKASKAKISAANKGKTPWNKGRTRSPEEKARIAAGVRAKNRERFLQKLADMGLTEEEYEIQKKEERRKKDAERRARKTENGGFRPTAETRQKISKVLKEKYANGEIKRKPVDPSKVRRGFTHSEETRKRISESLKKRWSTDEEYREKMQQKSLAFSNRDDIKKRISATLKQKWQDPEFCEEMMTKMGSRNSSQFRDPSHRAKISQTMKARWQDAEYRKKVLDSIAAKRGQSKPKQIKPQTPKVPATTATAPKSLPKAEVPLSPVMKSTRATLPVSALGATDSSQKVPKVVRGVRPMDPLTQPNRKVGMAKRKKKKKVASKATVAARASPKRSPPPKKAVQKKPTTTEVDRISALLDDDDDDDDDDDPIPVATTKAKAKDQGSVSRLREERRDLYDLLYGEDEATPGNSKLGSVFQVGDENLDTFDPYGLDDF